MEFQNELHPENQCKYGRVVQANRLKLEKNERKQTNKCKFTDR